MHILFSIIIISLILYYSMYTDMNIWTVPMKVRIGMHSMPDTVIHSERPVSRYLVATFGPQMRERGKGHIVNISSVAGKFLRGVFFPLWFVDSL